MAPFSPWVSPSLAWVHATDDQEKYTHGALRNAELAEVYFPGAGACPAWMRPPLPISRRANLPHPYLPGAFARYGLTWMRH